MKLYLLLIFLFLAGCRSLVPEEKNTPLPFVLNEPIKDINRLRWSARTPLEPQEAKKLFADREKTVLQLLLPTMDPYKGDDSTPILCRKENLPAPLHAQESGFSVAIAIYSSANMVLGSCSDPATLLKTQYQMLYCEKSKTAYFIQYFYNGNSPWLSSQLAHCPL